MLGLLSARVFLGSAQRRLLHKGTPIFVFHRIALLPPGAKDPFLYTRPERFNNILQSLRDAGFVAGSLDALPDQISTLVTHRTAIITFDDGFDNTLKNGVPLLKRHGFRAIQFLTVEHMGKQNDWDIAKGDVAGKIMDEAQVREWLAAGQQIGSHSATHRNLRHLSIPAAREEILGSKKALEDRFGVPVTHFCYPYGSWNNSVRNLVQEAGYQNACSLVFGVNSVLTDPFELRRIEPLSTTELRQKLCHRLKRKLRVN